eukprot:CAMPEP_0179854002 /NCGR_PEP_ID=MMETSP0982-20121206/9673_1 /TAXON_ID=483367 /ORGANISM="non described non described, Strain CCMP 2436" /LENGTH=196 /DNA_ID=CAMNT_0021739803 /DNA_START=770 /DNA_END=1358 /DNA_ORIENTATION=+
MRCSCALNSSNQLALRVVVPLVQVASQKCASTVDRVVLLSDAQPRPAQRNAQVLAQQLEVLVEGGARNAVTAEAASHVKDKTVGIAKGLPRGAGSRSSVAQPAGPEAAVRAQLHRVKPQGCCQRRRQPVPDHDDPARGDGREVDGHRCEGREREDEHPDAGRMRAARELWRAQEYPDRMRPLLELVFLGCHRGVYS